MKRYLFLYHFKNPFKNFNVRTDKYKLQTIQILTDIFIHNSHQNHGRKYNPKPERNILLKITMVLIYMFTELNQN